MQLLHTDRTLVYVGVVSAFFVALLVGWFAATASAFPLRKGYCDALDTVNYRFEDDVLNWTAALELSFNQASDNWDLIDDADGNTITDVKENDVRGAVPIELVDTVSLTICNELGNPIAVQMDGTIASSADFKGVTVHEIGHVIGLDHTGQWDSHDSDETTMTGCAITDHDIMITFEQDDAGSVVATFSDADLHANPSWEDTGNWTDDIWGAAGGSTLVNRSEASSPKGTRHGEIQDAGYIYQTMRVTDPGDMRAAFYVRKEIADATGTVALYLYARRIDYEVLPGSDICDDIWVNNWDLDEEPVDYPNGSAFTLYKVKIVTPTTSWPASEHETTAWTTVDGWEGVDVRVRVQNTLSKPGWTPDADVDHVRVRHLP